MAKLDFVVHSSLYNYGLIFSYEWANTYWLAYGIAFFAFSLMAGFIFWVGSQKTAHDKKILACLLLTINLLALGGLQDVIYFAVWAGGFPSNEVVWWWSYWSYVFGTWNSLMQITFTAIAITISVLTWVMVLKAKPFILLSIDDRFAKQSSEEHKITLTRD
jgi:ABC-type Mn2+/Zn2+ transport system permease subunit